MSGIDITTLPVEIIDLVVSNLLTGDGAATVPPHPETS